MTSNSEKALIASIMKKHKLNKRQQKWVKNQINDHHSTVLVNSVLAVIAILGWFWIIWVAVGS